MDLRRRSEARRGLSHRRLAADLSGRSFRAERARCADFAHLVDALTRTDLHTWRAPRACCSGPTPSTSQTLAVACTSHARRGACTAPRTRHCRHVAGRPDPRRLAYRLRVPDAL